MDLIVAVTAMGNALLNTFMYPGQLIAAFLGIDALQIQFRDTIILASGLDPIHVGLSLVIWVLVSVGVLTIIRRIVRLIRMVYDFVDGLVLRAKLRFVRATKSVKNVLTLGRYASTSESVSAGSIDLDDTDIAVLKFARARSPGLAISAPDLAEQLRCRPKAIQDRLQRLASYQLLENIIGSTDGYDNFALTPVGGAFVRKLP